jgi:hypothetical protein
MYSIASLYNLRLFYFVKFGIHIAFISSVSIYMSCNIQHNGVDFKLFKEDGGKK